MKRLWINCFFSIIILISWQSSLSFAYNPTHVQNHLFKQEEWLNLERPIASKDLSGRVILLNFWSYSCVNCLNIVPQLKSLEEKYGDNLTIIGIHSGKFANEKGESKINSAIKRYDIDHIVINDHDFKIWDLFGVTSWPSMVLIAPNGIIFSAYSGENNLASLNNDIDFLLGQYNFINNKKLPLLKYLAATQQENRFFPAKLHFAEKVKFQQKEQNVIFVADSASHKILALNEKGEIMLQIGSGIAGSENGDFAKAKFYGPQGLAYHKQKLYIADRGNHLIRMADLNKNQVTTLAGNGEIANTITDPDLAAKEQPLSAPLDLVFYPNKRNLVIANSGTNQLLTLNLWRNKMRVLAGNGREDIIDGKFPYNSLAQPTALHQYAEDLFFLDSFSSSLRKLNKDGEVTTLVGNEKMNSGFATGKKNTSLMQYPYGLTDDGNNLLIADSYNHAIRKFAIIDGYLDNFLGGQEGNNLGSFSETEFFEPTDIIKTDSPFIYYIADRNNHRVLKLDLESKSITKFYPRLE